MYVRPPASARIRIIQVLVLVATSLLTFGLLTLPIGLRPAIPQVDVGVVAPFDLQAPSDIEYVSEVRTDAARQAAESAVAPIYTTPDPAIARQQIERLRTTFQIITSVRDDQVLTLEEKKNNLSALSDVRLKPETIDYLLGISSSRWDATQQEALRVLEQVMRRSIHPDAVESMQNSVPNLVSLTLSEQQVALVAELASAFIVPNSFYSEELTQAARESARQAVEPVVQSYKAGETIVPGGEIITPADMEALDKLGLIRPGQRIEDTIGAAVLTLLSAVFVPMYFSRRRRLTMVNDPRSLLMIAIVFLIFLAGARLVTNRTLAPYAYPLQAAGLLITTLFGLEAGIAISVPLSLLAAYGLSNTSDLMPYYLLSSLIGILVLGPARRFWGFFRAGLGIALTGIAVIVVYRFPLIPTDWLGILQLAGSLAFCGFASASIALLLQFILAQTIGLTTSLQLLDISRPDFPLLQYFLRNAPGTYQHSLQVANLAEQAAEKIGADPLLTRVGAQFHDIGKAQNPTFFIENQLPGSVDKHDDLPPDEASSIIIRHVTDGIQTARKYRLPRRLEDFILEHHGTLITRYQYNQALEAAGGDASKVDIEKFRYPGPRPRSRETALLMLADAVEARARAERPANEDGLRALVRNVIDVVQKNNQLDDTTLTLRDLSLITESFVTTLRGTYHPRIQYPKQVTDEDQANPDNK
ncbi:MAG: HDIG domain-containing metalloprotein [Chloroflexota bacterium]